MDVAGWPSVFRLNRFSIDMQIRPCLSSASSFSRPRFCIGPALTEVYRFCWHRTGRTTLPVIFWKQFFHSNIRYLLSFLRGYPNIEKDSCASKRLICIWMSRSNEWIAFSFLNIEIIPVIVVQLNWEKYLKEGIFFFLLISIKLKKLLL